MIVSYPNHSINRARPIEEPKHLSCVGSKTTVITSTRLWKNKMKNHAIILIRFYLFSCTIRQFEVTKFVTKLEPIKLTPGFVMNIHKGVYKSEKIEEIDIVTRQLKFNVAYKFWIENDFVSSLQFGLIQSNFRFGIWIIKIRFEWIIIVGTLNHLK